MVIERRTRHRSSYYGSNTYRPSQQLYVQRPLSFVIRLQSTEHVTTNPVIPRHRASVWQDGAHEQRLAVNGGSQQFKHTQWPIHRDVEKRVIRMHSQSIFAPKKKVRQQIVT